MNDDHDKAVRAAALEENRALITIPPGYVLIEIPPGYVAVERRALEAQQEAVKNLRDRAVFFIDRAKSGAFSSEPMADSIMRSNTGRELFALAALAEVLK